MNNRTVRKKSKLLTVKFPGGFEEFVDVYRHYYDLRNVSDVLRHTVVSCDFDNFHYVEARSRQFSFRLPANAHRALLRCARRNRTSAGSIIRAALLEALPEQTQNPSHKNRVHTTMSTKPVITKKPTVPAKKPAPATKPAAPAKKPAQPAKKAVPAPKPVPAKKPAAPAKKIAPAPAKKSVPAPAKKPASAPVKKPVAAPAKKPAPAPAKKPVAPAKKPVAPAKKPVPAKKPAAPVKKAPAKK
jgi:hypothetical protein